MKTNQSELEYSEVHRNLGDPVYIWTKFGMRLTWGDMLLTGLAWFGTFIAFRIVAGRAKSPSDFEWGPLAALAAGLTVAYAISIMHRVRPELSLESLLRQGGAEFSPYCSAALPDKKHSFQSWKGGN